MSRSYLAMMAAGLIITAFGSTAMAQETPAGTTATTSVTQDDDDDEGKWGLLGLLGLAGLLGLRRRDPVHRDTTHVDTTRRP